MPDEQQAIRRLDAATIESVMDFLIYLHDCRDPDMGIPCAFHARERRQAIDVTYEQGIAAYSDAIAGEAPGLDRRAVIRGLHAVICGPDGLHQGTHALDADRFIAAYREAER